MLEVEKGRVTEPIDVTDAMLRTVPLTPRYAILEQHGNAEPEIRLIDDFRASAVNAIAECDDTNVPDNLDVFFAISAYLALVKPGRDTKCATADTAHAYKHVPLHADQREFATIILAPPSGCLKAASLRTQPFGSKRAPSNWARVAMFLKWAMLVFRHCDRRIR